LEVCIEAALYHLVKGQHKDVFQSFRTGDQEAL